MKVALDIANDPDMQAELTAQSARNETLAAGLDDAASRVTAVHAEPNWQLIMPDTAREGGKPICDGVLTVDDKEVYRFGFDGGDMGEGVETRKGETVTADSPTFYVWYDLKRGGLIVNIQLNAIRGEVPSVNVGARAHSRNATFGMNDDWARSAGENTRFERASGVTTIPGRWTFALPITPKVHQGFEGKIQAEIAIGPR